MYTRSHPATGQVTIRCVWDTVWRCRPMAVVKASEHPGWLRSEEETQEQSEQEQEQE